MSAKAAATAQKNTKPSKKDFLPDMKAYDKSAKKTEKNIKKSGGTKADIKAYRKSVEEAKRDASKRAEEMRKSHIKKLKAQQKAAKKKKKNAVAAGVAANAVKARSAHRARVKTLSVLIAVSVIFMLFALYRPFVTVSFEPNNDESSFSIVTVREQSIEKKLPSKPTKTGYGFDGWYADKALTSPFDTSSKISARTVLYAKWTPFSYQITYRLLGGEFDGTAYDGGKIPLVFTVEDEIILPTSSTVLLDGYVLIGWGTQPYHMIDNSIFKIPKGNIGNITLYAIWDKI